MNVLYFFAPHENSLIKCSQNIRVTTDKTADYENFMEQNNLYLNDYNVTGSLKNV